MKDPMTHPLEEAFNLEPGSYFAEQKDPTTEIMAQEIEGTAVATTDATYSKDQDDIDIDNKVDEIYDKALEVFNEQTNMVQVVDPRYAARTAEVANAYLNTALNAAALKARVKNDRNRVGQYIGFQKNVTNNSLIVADRNELLRTLRVDNTKKDEDKDK